MKYYKYTEEERMALKSIMNQISVRGYEQAKLIVMGMNIIEQGRPEEEPEEDGKEAKK